MSQLNDISLVAQVVVFRNTRAFDRLVGKYKSSVRRFFLHLTCGDSELSDDLAQDTFIKALNPQLHSRSATYIKRNGLLIRKITIKSSRPFQCAYHPLTP